MKKRLEIHMLKCGATISGVEELALSQQSLSLQVLTKLTLLLR